MNIPMTKIEYMEGVALEQDGPRNPIYIVRKGEKVGQVSPGPVTQEYGAIYVPFVATVYGTLKPDLSEQHQAVLGYATEQTKRWPQYQQKEFNSVSMAIGFVIMSTRGW